MLGIGVDGGAIRVTFFCGFFQKFQEEGIEATELVGISSGALIGVGYIGGVPMKDSFDMMIHWWAERRFNYKIYQEFANTFDYYMDDDMLRKVNAKLKILTTKLTWLGPETEVHDSFADKDELKQVMLASGSLPFINEFPMQIKDDIHIDGIFGCQNPAKYLTTKRKLTLLGIPEVTKRRAAEELGDVIAIDLRLEHWINTFLMDPETATHWYKEGYSRAEEYLRENAGAFA